MSKNRIKISLQLIRSRDEAEAVMHELANIANNKRKLVAKMDTEVLAAQSRYAAGIEQCEAEARAKTDALRMWAESNPQEFGKKKSIEFLAGVLGFRTGTPKLALLNRAWNWDKVTEAVCSFLPNFVRNKPEVDKEAILGQRDEEAIQAILPRVGLKVVQDESFYAEPKLTDADEVVKQAA